jgi:uncharacterized protein YdeI (YjbR/CyaY-like superfamily)
MPRAEQPSVEPTVSQPIFFADQLEWRAWLAEHHATATEVLVGFYKLSSGKSTMTWSDAVDQAICYGWIDGVRRTIDDESYYNRFTPRRSTSNWSNVNIEKVARLTAAGLMQPAGIAAFEKRTGHGYGATAPLVLDAAQLQLFQTRPGAWEFFRSQAPSYQKLTIHWIVSAKQEETRQRRLQKAIDASARGERI